VTGSGFANALDAALTSQSLSLAEVQWLLAQREVQLSIATLSYWRSGTRRPDPARSAATVAALESVLQLESGALSRHLSGHSRRLGAVGRMEHIDNMVPVNLVGPQSRVLRMRERLQASPHENYRLLSIQQTIDIDENLAISAVSTEMFIQCLQGSVESIGIIDIAAESTKTRPAVSASVGVTVEGPLVDEAEEVFGFRLVLERPLGPGETAMIEVVKAYPAGHPPERHHMVAVQRRAREILQWYRFTPGHTPDWFDEQERTDDSTTTITISDPTTVHRSRVDFGPGSVLAGWGYIDDF